MEIPVYSMEKKPVGQVEWPESIFGKGGPGVNRARIYQVVVQQLQNRRQGNAKVKNRHEVSGSTRKIYRQKGTGRARHGDIKAPLFVGGGQAFGPKPRSWRGEIPRAIRRGALRDLVLLKREENKLWLVDKLSLPKPKTREMAAFFARFGISSGLLVLGGENHPVQKSVRNLPSFKALRLDALNAVDMARYDHLILTQEAYERFLERFGES